MLASNITDKGLILLGKHPPKLQVILKKTKNPVEKWGKNAYRLFPVKG